MLLRFGVGDWSGDGHGKTEVFLVESSHSADDVAAAYQYACERIGFIFHNEVSADYEDNRIGAERLAALQAIGYDPIDLDPEWLAPSDVWDMFVALVQHGNPTITLEEVDAEDFFRPTETEGVHDHRSFSIGYGCF